MNHEELFWLRIRGEGKEASRAVESWKYTRPADHGVKFGKKEGEQMDRMSDRETADSLLVEWFRWSKVWRPALGAPRIAPSCREYRQDEKHNEDSDGYEAVHKREMEAVDFCVGAIGVPMQQAIGTEMRNREAKAKVWRDPGNRAFSDALNAVLLHMRKHRDLMALFN